MTQISERLLVQAHLEAGQIKLNFQFPEHRPVRAEFCRLRGGGVYHPNVFIRLLSHVNKKNP